MTLETSKCSDFFALTFTTKINALPKGWDVVKHWFLFLRVETHRVKYILKKLLEAMLCLFSQRLMMEKCQMKICTIYNKGLTKIKEMVNDLNYSA